VLITLHDKAGKICYEVRLVNEYLDDDLIPDETDFLY